MKTVEACVAEILEKELALSEDCFVFPALNPRIKNLDKDFYAIQSLFYKKINSNYRLCIQLDICSYKTFSDEKQKALIKCLTESNTSLKIQKEYNFSIDLDSFSINDLSFLQKLKFNRYVFRFCINFDPKYLKFNATEKKE